MKYPDDFINKVINGDCLDVMKQMPDKCVDLVVTDPPYGINYKDWDKFDFVEFTNKWLEECFRVLKDNGTMWSFMGYQKVFDFVPLLNKYGICHLENWTIWARGKGRGSSKHLKSIREDIFHTTKTKNFIWNNIQLLREVTTPYTKDGKPRGWFVDDKGKKVRWTGLGNVWVFTAPWFGSIEDKQVHPAQKPIAMLKRLIEISSNKNDIILDPFNGSGSTALAAKKLVRQYIGIEISPEYCKIAEQRLAQEMLF